MIKFIYMINTFDKTTLFRDIIEAKNKDVAKEVILNNHKEMFPNGKAYQKRKKGEEVYVSIFELSGYWEKYWTEKIECRNCGLKFATNLEVKNMSPFENQYYCSEHCKVESKKLMLENYESNPYNSYIYKITEKSTNKNYVGKTTKHFIWRWWEHIKATSGSKFHEFIKSSEVSNIAFEVLEVIVNGTDEYISERETYWIFVTDSIEKGFNTNIPNKKEYIRLTKMDKKTANDDIAA